MAADNSVSDGPGLESLKVGTSRSVEAKANIADISSSVVVVLFAT